MKSIALLQKIMSANTEKEIIKNDSEGNNIVTVNKVKSAMDIEEYNRVQDRINVKIPDDYKSFLGYTNGASLFNYDNIDGLELLSVLDILKYTLYAQNTFEEDWDENIVIFAKIIGEDNYLGFKIESEGEYKIVDCYFEQLPSEWNEMNMSFDEFLMRYISGLGEKFWIV